MPPVRLRHGLRKTTGRFTKAPSFIPATPALMEGNDWDDNGNVNIFSVCYQWVMVPLCPHMAPQRMPVAPHVYDQEKLALDRRKPR